MSKDIEPWLAAAIDYIPRWVAFQLRAAEQPGGSFAIARQGRVVCEFALGHADAVAGEKLTPRHAFRVASHSKSFAAAAVLKLREQGRWQLDDAVGRHVSGLHPDVAAVTLNQLLSHSAGLVRDGADAGQFADRRPYLNEAELRADLAGGTVLPANTRFKYSNHGYGLIGLAIEAVTGERYADWMTREIIVASGLKQTFADGPPPPKQRFARGHGLKWPLGQRLVVPGDNPTQAMAAAAGVISTAADLARFYWSLAPEAATSVLSVASRRELVRRQWRDPYGTVERWYGLGTISGSVGDWSYFGHTGGFQGTITRTVCLPQQGLSISGLSNATDGASHVWVEGALHILRAFAQHGAASANTAAWQGRWWSPWGAFDLLPMTVKVVVANPALANPLQDASEIAPDGDSGRIVLAGGYASHGEPARLLRDARGRVTTVWLGGSQLRSEAATMKELKQRYGGAS